MRNWNALIGMALSVILVGTVSAAEESAPTHQDMVPAGTASSQPAAGETTLPFAVACPASGAPAARLRFELPESQYVTLRIYDEGGHLVCGLLEGERPAGNQIVAWNGCDGEGRSLDGGHYYALLGVCGRYQVRSVDLDSGDSQ